MNRENAKIFLENLIDRIVRDRESGKWKLDGLISKNEYDALLVALEVTGGLERAKEIEERRETSAPGEASATLAELNLEALNRDEPEDEPVLLCLDFGTALSKAFATNKSDSELLDLAIGKRAGQTSPVYSLVSSLYISEGGKILFGHHAVAQSLSAESAGRRRFDSLKDILCKDPIGDLDEVALEKEYNPTDVFLSKADIVTLFLAYFTDMAVSELADRFKISRYVRRRFTRPILPPERTTWAEDQLRKLLARAQILADSLHGCWDQGIRVERAKSLLRTLRLLEELPVYLIDQGVVEPVAAVASRVRDYLCNKDYRGLLMVIDVGAGTMDFAMFLRVEKAGQAPSFWEIPGSTNVLRQAGDKVDALLKRFILKQADVSSSDADYHRIDAGLSARIRVLKEELFRSGAVTYALENDATGTVGLEHFLSYPSVIELEKAIHSKFMEVLENVHPSWIKEASNGKMPIVFTGGGANLPFVRSIAENRIMVQESQLEVKGATAVPDWIKDQYPELELEYAQLAVAIGGASKHIPQLAPETYVEFGGLSDQGWYIAPIQKGV